MTPSAPSAAVAADRRPGAATAAFLRPGVRSFFPSSDRALSGLVMGALAAGSIFAASALSTDEGRHAFVDFMEARIGPEVDAVEASVSRIAQGGARRLRNLSQAAVEATDRKLRPEDYEEPVWTAPAEPLTQNAPARPLPATGPDRHEPGKSRPHKRGRRVAHHRRPEPEPEAPPPFGFRRP